MHSDANFSPADLAEWLGYYSFPSQTVAIDIGGHNSSSECRTKKKNYNCPTNSNYIGQQKTK